MVSGCQTDDIHWGCALFFDGDKDDRRVTGFIMRYPIGAVILLLIKFSREFEN